MRQVYNVLTELHDYLVALPNVNTVTFGEISDVDIQKQSVFPLVHMTIDSANLSGNMFNTLEVQLSFIVMDLVDYSKADPRYTSNELGKNVGNLQDVLNNMLVVCNSLASTLKRGALNTEFYRVEDDVVTMTPFLERFENNLAGWAMSVTITMPNTDIYICS